ncbi:MAG: hypothetical protein M1814_005536 [Vezdaea aestivalis]|nr:MAG: hypothetical protein M1814_005536 [Vezdaea aestivalis]
MNPFNNMPSLPGHGAIVVSHEPPSTPLITSLAFTYPLKLISPDPLPSSPASLTFLLTYGGGLVAGDAIQLSITLCGPARLALITQGSTKIFKTPHADMVSRQSLDVRIEGHEGGGLCYLPDPVQPFGDSVYEQKQIFRVHLSRASLCVLDWVSEGRKARGECWDLSMWRGVNEVWTGEKEGEDRLLLRDSLLLEREQKADGHLRAMVDGKGVIGTLILRGPLFESLGSFFMEEFRVQPRVGERDWDGEEGKKIVSEADSWRALRLQKERKDGVLWTAAAIRGFVMIKFSANAVEGARHWLGNMLEREGSVEKNFGEEALLCLR